MTKPSEHLFQRIWEGNKEAGSHRTYIIGPDLTTHETITHGAVSIPFTPMSLNGVGKKITKANLKCVK